MRTKFDNMVPGVDRYGDDLRTDAEGETLYPENLTVSLDKTTKPSVFGGAEIVSEYVFKRIENGCYIVTLLGKTLGVPSRGTANTMDAQAEIETQLFN